MRRAVDSRISRDLSRVERVWAFRGLRGWLMSGYYRCRFEILRCFLSARASDSSSCRSQRSSTSVISRSSSIRSSTSFVFFRRSIRIPKRLCRDLKVACGVPARLTKDLSCPVISGSSKRKLVTFKVYLAIPLMRTFCRGEIFVR